MCCTKKRRKKKPIIVIDAGHGGHDNGAIGHNGIKEKQITLILAQMLAPMLQKKGVHTALTRSDDAFVHLDDRTWQVNNEFKGDLLISLHANYHSNPQTKGIETFCLSSHLFTSGSKQDEKCAFIDQLLHEKYERSRLFADCVQRNLIKQAGTYEPVIDRGVKHAAIQVLMGVHIPAILVEVGFVTNEDEARLLTDQAYLSIVAQSIADAIMEYLHKQTF